MTVHLVAVQNICASHQIYVFTEATPLTSFERFIACQRVIESISSSIHKSGSSLNTIAIELFQITSTLSNELSSAYSSLILLILSWTTSTFSSVCCAGAWTDDVVVFQSFARLFNIQQTKMKTITRNCHFLCNGFFAFSSAILNDLWYKWNQYTESLSNVNTLTFQEKYIYSSSWHKLMKHTYFYMLMFFCYERIQWCITTATWLWRKRQKSQFIYQSLLYYKKLLKISCFYQATIQAWRNWTIWNHSISCILQNAQKLQMNNTEQMCWIQCDLCNQMFFQVLQYDMNEDEIQSRTDSDVQTRASETWANERRRLSTNAHSNQIVFKIRRNQIAWWTDDWNTTRNLIEKIWNCQM